jgi:hypothetical protein
MKVGVLHCNFEDLITKQVSSSLIGRAIGLSENPLLGSTLSDPPHGVCQKGATAYCRHVREESCEQGNIVNVLSQPG